MRTTSLERKGREGRERKQCELEEKFFQASLSATRTHQDEDVDSPRYTEVLMCCFRI